MTAIVYITTALSATSLPTVYPSNWEGELGPSGTVAGCPATSSSPARAALPGAPAATAATAAASLSTYAAARGASSSSSTLENRHFKSAHGFLHSHNDTP